MRKYYFLLLLFIFKVNITEAQPHPFTMELEPFTITGLPGLHSYATTKFDGKWLIIGGRTNGLHGWQPPVAFPNNTQNSNIYVVDPVNQQVWSSSAMSLPQSIFEHISSSNMSGVQLGNYFYFIGGYGYSTPANDLISFPNITAIDVPGLMNAVINQLPISTFFRQITNQQMAVCGSRAEVLDSTVMLVFGHRFDGRYNPQNMPSFTQTYTNSIKKFNIIDNGTTFSINNYVEDIDPVNFHRRDYNLVYQILPGGVTGLTAFTGVFQYNLNMPYLNSIDITTNGNTVNSTLVQQLNQYHSANIPLYDSVAGNMYTFFMGGMAQYYYDINNNLTLDSLVPFVKTISYITRNNIQETESNFSIEMPGYLGSNMEFYNADSIDIYQNGIIKLSEVDTGKVLIGYLYGGIESDFPYVFMNGGGTSWANNIIYKVYITKPGISGINISNEFISNFNCYQNNTFSELTIDFSLIQSAHITCSIYDSSGRLIKKVCNERKEAGSYQQVVNTNNFNAGTYILNMNANGYFKNYKFQIKK